MMDEAFYPRTPTISAYAMSKKKPAKQKPVKALYSEKTILETGLKPRVSRTKTTSI